MYGNTAKQHDRIQLWGAPSSLWSGRVRAYLIKKEIDYQEIFPSDPRYQKDVLPHIGYFAVPVSELKDGTLIQDGTDTMEYLEQHYPDRPMIPSSPLQKAIAWLIEFFGCDAFWIPAMHYRWNFPEQDSYIEAEFARALSLAKDLEGQQRDLAPIKAMFSDFPALMGINEQTIPAIESSHLECLELLNPHFLHHPYILGGHPSIADFGLIGPLYAHLGRDPVPASLMKNVAPHVYRWTERMFEAGRIDGQFPNYASEFPADDEIPETLIPFIEYLFRDCGPQIQGTVETYNAWVSQDPSAHSGSRVQRDPDASLGAHPQLGQFEYTLRGVKVSTESFANVVYHFQRLLDVVNSLSHEGRENFESLVEKCGGNDLMSIELTRRIKSENYQFLLA